MDNYNHYNNSMPPQTKCPGKEITGMVLGINAIAWSGLGMLFCWHFALGLVYGLLGIGCGIGATVLHKKVHEQATYITNKIELGKKLGIAGIIVGSILLLISFLILVAFIALGVAASIYS